MADTSNPQELSAVKRALMEIRDLRARLAAGDQRLHAPIAIVGMGMRFPGGVVDADSFWSLLHDGVDAITEVPPSRWEIDALYNPDPEHAGTMSTRFGGFLSDIDQFDARFFGISPREAESMDPQQRLLLEVTWEALENGAIAPDSLYETQAGVYLGISNSDYLRLMLRDAAQIDSYVTTGSAASVAAGRISYTLGLRGPSIAFDTACSSSLVAIHAAMQSLRSGTIDMALAGGVNIMLAPELTINFSRANMMAPDGRCKTFDADADGYVRAEGCAMIVLKRLDDAQAAGDRVLAVIRGAAINQDGRSGGITAPNGPAQEQVILAALADARMDVQQVDYVEAHGTGTPLGDPIEVRALVQTLGSGRSADNPLIVGSVKTNLGHTEAVAGIAGVIKTVLALQHGEIPPHLHLNTLSPHIAAIGGALHFPNAPMAWPARDHVPTAGVSSFGLSGTNAHVILTAAPAPAMGEAAAEREVASAAAPHIVTLSARTSASLRASVARFAAHLDAHLDAQPGLHLADIAFSANTGRNHWPQRLAVVARDTADLRAQLLNAANSVSLAPTSNSTGTLGPVFLFTGQGAHYAGMGRALYATEPAFRAVIDECAALLATRLDRPLADILFGSESDALLARMEYAQPALCALQVALCALWQSWGIAPAAVAGHSAGEYAAAIVAGVMTLADGLALIAERGRLMSSLERAVRAAPSANTDAADACMIALFAPAARVEQAVANVVAQMGSVLGIAAYNGPENIVISGRRDGLDAVIAALALGNDERRALEISIAAHSPLMEPILAPFAQAVAHVTLAEPQIPFVSTLSGNVVQERAATPNITTAAYWRQQMREPVRFAQAIETLYAKGYRTFVEIGPHPTLSAMAQRCLPDAADAHWAQSLSRKAGEAESIYAGLATLYMAGVEVNWPAFHSANPARAGRKIALPTYAWQHERYWSPAARQGQPSLPQLPAAEAWPMAVASAQRQADQAPLDLHLDSFAAGEAHLDQLALDYIVQAMHELGAYATSGECWNADALIEQKGIAPTYRHLIGRWLKDLAHAGYVAHIDDNRYCAERALPAIDLAARLAAAQAVIPGPLLAYVRRCGEGLAAVLTGSESALNTLFPDGSYETVDFLYNGWAAARYMNAIARAVAEALARARAGHPLRVLEIGAGTGGTAAALLPALDEWPARYLFTDVSDFFLTRAAERFAAFPFVDYGLLNIEEPPETQGLALHSYDMVVAANVLHATRDLNATLRHAAALLAPGGTLLLYEATSHPRWLSMTTGLIEGWQRFEDTWRTDQPLLDVATWDAALRANGFVDVAALPGAGHPADLLGQHILLARAPGQAGDAVEAAPSPAAHAQPDAESAAPAAPLPALAEAEALRAALSVALPDERTDLLVSFVRQAIARVLRLRDWQSLQRNQPLLDLGFDSLMAVELRNVLRQGLELPRKLPATLVFDYPSIAAIAAYLEKMLVETAPAGETLAQNADQPAATPTSVEALAALSDAEVEAMLLKKLAQL